MLYTLFKIFLISMTPIGELRAGIPYGLLKDINFVLVFSIAVIGNMIPVFFLVYFLPWFEKKVLGEALNKTLNGKSTTRFSRLYRWFRDRTERRYSKRFSLLGAFALISFVAIPLPITGAWTGTFAAHIFGIPSKKALPLIFAGVIIAGIVVTLIGLKIF